MIEHMSHMEKDLPHDLSISGTIFLGRKVNECVLVFYRVCMRVCVSELERVYVKECVCVHLSICAGLLLLLEQGRLLVFPFDVVIFEHIMPPL